MQATTHAAITEMPGEPRIDYATTAAEAVRVQFGLESYVRRSALEPELLALVKLRASYMNGCAYCVDMHTKDARHEGESEQRLYAVPVWRETPFFTPRERTALAWTEALTDIGRHGVSDELFDAVRQEFSEKEIVDLTMAINSINNWNRLSIAFRAPVGSYVPGQR